MIDSFVLENDVEIRERVNFAIELLLKKIAARHVLLRDDVDTPDLNTAKLVTAEVHLEPVLDLQQVVP
jgi:hypothetical protein